MRGTVADHVIPAPTAAVTLLENRDRAEADNSRRAVLVAVDASGRSGRGEPGSVTLAATREITAELRAA